MKNWQQILVSDDSTLEQAMSKIDAAGTQLAIVVDSATRLKGTLSDGDVRRALLHGLSVSDRVSNAMCREPVCAHKDTHKSLLKDLIVSNKIRLIPILSKDGVVIDVITLDDLFECEKRENIVVVMAGGLGKRLGKLTRDIPKPMLQIHGTPILEIIINQLISQGFKNYFLAVNYKADQIKDYFGDGKLFGIKIQYIEEPYPLGTAGALSLIPEIPADPIVVINGDVLFGGDIANLLDNHIASGAVATMAVRDYEIQIPYGVVKTEENKIQGFDEKPIHKFAINAGMYVLSPQALRLVPEDTFFDMPQLFKRVLSSGKDANTYWIDDYWIDIGEPNEFKRAQDEFELDFK